MNKNENVERTLGLCPDTGRSLHGNKNCENMTVGRQAKVQEM